MYLLRIKHIQDTKKIKFSAFRIFSPPKINPIFNILSRTETVFNSIPVFINDMRSIFFENLEVEFDSFYDSDLNLNDSLPYTEVPSFMFNFENFSITEPKMKLYPVRQIHTLLHIQFKNSDNDSLSESDEEES